MTALSLRGVRKTFGSTIALDGVDLDVAGGEVVAVIGENGAGKSTLLNIASGAMKPDGGTLFAPSGVAYIRQELALFPHLSVAENIFLGREPSRLGLVDTARLESSAADLLARFGRPEIAPGDLVGALPAASRQVVEICRALARDASVILMDEPTSSLDRNDVARLFEAIRALVLRGIGVVYVSHFLEEVREIASRAVVLRDGRSVWAGELRSASDEDLVAQMVGRDVETRETSRPTAAWGEIALRVAGVRGATFDLHAGEILGVAGLVGSGRTELLRAIYGLDPDAHGFLQVEGVEVPARLASPARSIGRGVGFLSEDRNLDGLFHGLSIAENIEVARPEAAGAERLRGELRIKAPDLGAPIRSLSGGNQQKALLARLLHQKARILLLDEPTRGIDVGTKAEIYERLRALASEGRAILIVSSYLPELFSLCDRIAVMSRRGLIPPRPVAEWTPDLVLSAAISGESAA